MKDCIRLHFMSWSSSFNSRCLRRNCDPNERVYEYLILLNSNELIRKANIRTNNAKLKSGCVRLFNFNLLFVINEPFIQTSTNDIIEMK